MNQRQDIIYETTNWKIILTDDQNYLGRCIVVLKRKCGDLAELEEDEILDFFAVVKKMENVFKQTFNATMFNWTCLMNNAYQTTPANPQVHWHLRPRYNHIVTFAGETFKDPNFGHHYIRDEEARRDVSDELFEKILTTLKNNL